MQMQMVRRRPPTPQAKFDRIARRYDMINAALSLGVDSRWRKDAARRLAIPPGVSARVLDVATGTASMALALTTIYPDARVVGCDVNRTMLEVGRERVARAGRGDRIDLVHAVGERLPFDDHSFDAVTIAFAIDDMEDRDACARELFRVLKPGGRVSLLELSLPEQPILLGLYRLYLRLLAVVGSAPSGDGYAHLREEILTYRGRDAIRALFETTGFEGYARHAQTFGVATVHVATRPREAA